MTIDEVRDYAKDCRIPTKRIEALITDLHPDKNGQLSLEESLQAIQSIRLAANSMDKIRIMLKAGKRARQSAGYTRVPTDEQADGNSLQDQKDSATEEKTYTITLTREQYIVIKTTLKNEQAKAFIENDQLAFEMIQSAYQAVIGSVNPTEEE